MSRNKHTQSNTATASNNNIRVKAHYVAKHTEKMLVELNGKQIEIRRVWDSKKMELKKELQELAQIPDAHARSLSVIATCLQSVGLKWSDTPVKTVGTVKWREGDQVHEAPALKVKFLQNGGQLRLVRNSDGTERIDLDVVTKTTINQCIRDCQNWTEEDQEALDNYTAGLARRKADRDRHTKYERDYVSEFSIDEAFSQVGL